MAVKFKSRFTVTTVPNFAKKTDTCFVLMVYIDRV